MFGNTSTPFGQKPATTSTTNFGTGLTQPTFGSPATSAFGAPQQSTFGQPSGTLSFGQTANTGFGQATATPTFGQQNATPAFGQQNATPAFGQQSATPAFGQQSATPAFGQQSTTAAFGQAATTPAFGTPATQPSFAQSTPTPAFGSTAQPFSSSTTLAFGGNQQQKPAFGTPTTTAAQPSLTFGGGTTATSTTQPTGFSFGTNLGQSGFGAPTPAATTTTSTISTTTSQATLGFSATQITTPLSFGTGKTSFGSVTSTTPSSLTFGSTLVSKPSTVTSSGFAFGTTTTSLSTPGAAPAQTLTAGLGSYTSTGLSLGPAVGKSMLTITGNTATPLYSTKASDLQAGRSPGQIPPKCQTIHNLLQELVESFKNHIKDQKHLCLEVSRASLKPINKISNDAENIKKSVMKLERAVNKNKLLNSKLKDETIKALADAEVAQKAMDYPGGFPCDNSIITDYFLQLANKFQQQIVSLRVELESTEKSILCELNPVAFTPEELSTTMQRLYECFVALAGRFQFVHAQISNLKVQHLELRKKKLEDYTDIFNKKKPTPPLKSAIQATEGSLTPSSLTGLRSLNTIANQAKQLNSSLPTTFSPAPPGNPIFNSPLNQSLQNNNLLSTSPQLMAPGSKRGKR